MNNPVCNRRPSRSCPSTWERGRERGGRARAARIAGLLVLLGPLGTSPGCSYAQDRILDLSDVVDVKYGVALGVGAKVEVTDYVGVGSGLALELPVGEEWYGRRVARVPGFGFFHIPGLFGFDDLPIDNVDQYASSCVFVYNKRKYRPPMIDRFRVGAEALVPGLHLGLYLNTGEVFDFLAGIAGLDPAGDDDVPKGTRIDFSYLPRHDEAGDGKPG